MKESANDFNELDLQRIRQQSFVSQIDFYEEAESTNKTAIQRNADPDCSLPLLVIAKKQTAGRGRGSNLWWSGDGALTFTLLIDLPVKDPARFSSFSLTTGLAICQALQPFAPQATVKLKWPNDVYLDDKKICGILTERPSTSESRLVVGIGINVNNSFREAPAEQQQKATSIIDATGSAVSLTDLLVQCLTMLQARQQDHLHDTDALMASWPQWCLLTGRQVAIEMHGKTIRGTCHGIGTDGALIIDDRQQQHHCISGVVTYFEGNR